MERAQNFKRPEVDLEKISPNVNVYRGKEYYCPWGCAGMLQGLMDPYAMDPGKDGIKKMNVIIGKPIDHVPDDLDPDITLVLGNCAEQYRGLGHFIPGCCPRPLDVSLFVRRIQGSMGILEDEMTFENMRNGLRAYNGHRLWRMRRRLAGKKLEPIENHVTLGMAVKEISAGKKLKNK